MECSTAGQACRDPAPGRPHMPRGTGGTDRVSGAQERGYRDGGAPSDTSHQALLNYAWRGHGFGRWSAPDAGHERIPVAGGDPLLVGPIEPGGLKKVLDATVGAGPVRVVGSEQDALHADNLDRPP